MSTRRRSIPEPDSELEGQLLFELHALGLPRPERQHKFHPSRTWRFDFAWPLQMLAVEVDGGTWSGGRHVRPDGFQRDVEKLNAAAELGWTVLRFTGDDVTAGRAFTQIERWFAQHGEVRHVSATEGSIAIPRDEEGAVAQAKKSSDKTGDLGKYRGKPVTETTAKITNTGDGLSKAMELEPVVYEPGDLVTFVIRARTGFHRYDLDDEGKGFILQQQFSAGTIAVIDDDLVADALNEMERRITEAEDAKRGQMTLPGQDAATGRSRMPKGRRGTLAVVPDDEPGEAVDETEDAGE